MKEHDEIVYFCVLAFGVLLFGHELLWLLSVLSTR